MIPVARRIGVDTFHHVKVEGADLVSLCNRARGPRGTWFLSPSGAEPTCGECLRLRLEETQAMARAANERRAGR